MDRLLFDDAADRHEAYERWIETHCRPTHPSTSMEAAQKMAPKVGSAMARALALLREHPESTATELDAKVRNNGSVRKRLTDLKARGLAKVVGKRKCRITGMNAQVWVAIDRDD